PITPSPVTTSWSARTAGCAASSAGAAPWSATPPRTSRASPSPWAHRPPYGPPPSPGTAPAPACGLWLARCDTVLHLAEALAGRGTDPMPLLRVRLRRAWEAILLERVTDLRGPEDGA